MLIGLILVSVALAAAAQLTLKHGMNQVTDAPADVASSRHARASDRSRPRRCGSAS